MSVERPFQPARRRSLAGRALRTVADPYVQCGVLIVLYFTLILIVPALTRLHFEALESRDERTVPPALQVVSGAEQTDDRMWRSTP